MTITDTDPLKERIRRARSLPAEWARRRDGETTMEQTERWQKRQDEQTATLVAVEVRKAKAEALREAAENVDVGALADAWTRGAVTRLSVTNAVAEVLMSLRNRATEYETGAEHD